MTDCDTLGSKVNTDFSKSEQARHELIFREGRGHGLASNPFLLRPLKFFYADLDLTPSSGMLAILITA